MYTRWVLFSPPNYQSFDMVSGHPMYGYLLIHLTIWWEPVAHGQCSNCELPVAVIGTETRVHVWLSSVLAPKLTTIVSVRTICVTSSVSLNLYTTSEKVSWGAGGEGVGVFSGVGRYNTTQQKDNTTQLTQNSHFQLATSGGIQTHDTHILGNALIN